MDKYIESNVNLLIRLTREAKEPDIDVRRLNIYVKAISAAMNTIEKYHGLYYLQYIAYVASTRLGHAIGPFNEHVASTLTKNNSILPYTLIIQFQTYETVHKQNQYVS
jgi:hypothetical protein